MHAINWRWAGTQPEPLTHGCTFKVRLPAARAESPCTNSEWDNRHQDGQRNRPRLTARGAISTTR